MKVEKKLHVSLESTAFLCKHTNSLQLQFLVWEEPARRKNIKAENPSSSPQASL